MELGILVNCINVMFGTVCIVYGIHFCNIVRQKRAHIRYIMLVTSIAAGMWNFSLAGYGFCTDYNVARAFFSTLIISIHVYIVSIYFLITLLLPLKGLKKYAFLLVGILISASDIIIYGLRSNQKFVTINGRTSYYLAISHSSLYHFFCLGLIVLFGGTVVLMGVRKKKYKRDKKFIIDSLSANVMILVFTIPDTIMPSLGMPSFPSSGYGALIAFLVMQYYALHYNTFDLTTDNISKYVYQIVNNGILVFDNALKLHLNNSYADTLLNIGDNENLYLWDLFQISRDDAFEMQKIATEGAVLYERYEARNTDIPCSVIPAVAKDEYGEPYCLILVLSDISKENEMMEAIVKADQAKSDFLANMSHEIRTPINVVMGMNELILRESKNKTIAGYASNIKKSGNLLLSIINDILDFSKIESGKLEIVPAQYDLAVLINDCMNTVSGRAKEKEISVSLDCDKQLPALLYGDEIRIGQAFSNVLTNAVKYTREKGTVNVHISGNKLDENKLELIFKVKDTGIGIKKEDIASLFDAFQRFDSKKTRSIEGTGLGLTITKQLIDLMDGEISVESEYGKGSEFIIRIPQLIISQKGIGDVQNIKGTYYTDYTCMFRAPNAKVLVVDDMQMNLSVFEGLLKDTQLTIDKCASGEEALRIAQKKKYDIIFMDHMMPGLDGIQTLKYIKSLENAVNYNTPVIMLSANALSGMRETYLSEGFCDYLTKPIQTELLEEMIIKYLPEDKIILLNEDDSADGKEQESAESETDELLEKMSFLHTDLAMSYCANSIELYRDVLNDYVNYSKYSDLVKSYEQEDWEHYKVFVHALKSSSLSIGAPNLSESAKEMENAIVDGNINYIHENHNKLLKSYEKILTNIKAALSE